MQLQWEEQDFFTSIILDWLGESNLFSIAALEVSFGRKAKALRRSLQNLVILQSPAVDISKSISFLSWCKSRNVSLRHIIINSEILWDLAHGALCLSFNTVYAVALAIPPKSIPDITPMHLHQVFPSAEHVIFYSECPSQHVDKNIPPSSLRSHPALCFDGTLHGMIVHHGFDISIDFLLQWIQYLYSSLYFLIVVDGQWEEMSKQLIVRTDTIPHLQEIRFLQQYDNRRYSSTTILSTDLQLWIQMHRESLRSVILPKFQIGAADVDLIRNLLVDCSHLHTLEFYQFNLKRRKRSGNICASIMSGLSPHSSQLFRQASSSPSIDHQDALALISSTLFADPIALDISVFKLRDIRDGEIRKRFYSATVDIQPSGKGNTLRALAVKTTWSVFSSIVGKYSETLEAVGLEMIGLPINKDIAWPRCPNLSTIYLCLPSLSESIPTISARNEFLSSVFASHSHQLSVVTFQFTGYYSESGSFHDELIRSFYLPILELCPRLEDFSINCNGKDYLSVKHSQNNVVTILWDAPLFGAHLSAESLFHIMAFYCRPSSGTSCPSQCAKVAAIELVVASRDSDLLAAVDSVLWPMIHRFGTHLVSLRWHALRLSWDDIESILTQASTLHCLVAFNLKAIRQQVVKLVDVRNDCFLSGSKNLLPHLLAHFRCQQLVSLELSDDNHEEYQTSLGAALTDILTMEPKQVEVHVKALNWSIFHAHYCKHRTCWNRLHAWTVISSVVRVEMRRLSIAGGYRLSVRFCGGDNPSNYPLDALVEIINCQADVKELKLKAQHSNNSMIVVELLYRLDEEKTCALDVFDVSLSVDYALVKVKAGIRKHLKHITTLDCKEGDARTILYRS